VKLLVERGPDDGKAIMGKLYADGNWEMFTLEPSASAAYPCIPEGTYPVALIESPRFGEITPHIQSVPGRSFIEIHPGNAPEDTKGCTLVGMSESADWVGSSRPAFLYLMTLLEPNAEGLTITLENPTSDIFGVGGNEEDNNAQT
jgi:hypothetical protein